MENNNADLKKQLHIYINAPQTESLSKHNSNKAVFQKRHHFLCSNPKAKIQLKPKNNSRIADRLRSFILKKKRILKPQSLSTIKMDQSCGTDEYHIDPNFIQNNEIRKSQKFLSFSRLSANNSKLQKYSPLKRRISKNINMIPVIGCDWNSAFYSNNSNNDSCDSLKNEYIPEKFNDPNRFRTRNYSLLKQDSSQFSLINPAISRTPELVSHSQYRTWANAYNRLPFIKCILRNQNSCVKKSTDLKIKVYSDKNSHQNISRQAFLINNVEKSARDIENLHERPIELRFKNSSFEDLKFPEIIVRQQAPGLEINNNSSILRLRSLLVNRKNQPEIILYKAVQSTINPTYNSQNLK